MVSVDRALELILAAVRAVKTEQVNTLESAGRITAQDIVAPFSLPPFDNSAMDGYAVRSEDCAQLGFLQTSGFIPAGADDWLSLQEGSAVRIMTGAPLPENADAVVPLEETIEDASERIRALSIVRKGQHIRFAGEDVKKGSTVVRAGIAIGVPEINLLAALGIATVHVYNRPVFAIIATGDELIPVGAALGKGKIFDSNSIALAAAVEGAGGAPKVLGIAKDDRESLREKIEEGVEADGVIIAAGVSVGDRDLVRQVLAAAGANEHFSGVDMKPGKATAFCVLAGKPIFCLPGNPVSAIVTFEELVRPALLTMAGKSAVIRPLASAILQEPLRKTPGKIFFARVKLKFKNGKLLAWSSGSQNTAFQSSLLNADAIAILPASRSMFIAGEEINVHVLSANIGMLEASRGLSAS